MIPFFPKIPKNEKFPKAFFLIFAKSLLVILLVRPAFYPLFSYLFRTAAAASGRGGGEIQNFNFSGREVGKIPIINIID